MMQELAKLPEMSEANVAAAQDIPVGSHIVSERPFYTHHGIYIGNGRVIHYSGLSDSLLNTDGTIEETDLQGFRNGGGVIRVRPYAEGAALPAEQIVARARSKLGERSYRIFDNNCEHFACWCVTGKAESRQVQRVLTAAALGVLWLLKK